MNFLLSVFAFLIWSAIIFMSYILYIVSDVYKFLGSGILIYCSALVYILALILPVIFRKQIKKYFSLPLVYIIFSVFSVIITGIIYVGADSYISEFSRQKWNDNPRLRIHMLDDLNEKYEIEGKTKEEISSLLGDPEYVSETGTQKTFEYYVGDSIIDPYGFVIEFENDVAVNTKLVEH